MSLRVLGIILQGNFSRFHNLLLDYYPVFWRGYLRWFYLHSGFWHGGRAVSGTITEGRTGCLSSTTFNESFPLLIAALHLEACCFFLWGLILLVGCYPLGCRAEGWVAIADICVWQDSIRRRNSPLCLRDLIDVLALIVPVLRHVGCCTFYSFTIHLQGLNYRWG